MLLFIIPLKSKEVSQSWTSTCQLLERCLRSICNQTDSRFQVLVVCNGKPDISYAHPQIEYLEVDLQIPETYEEKSFDKSKKTILGLLYSQKFSVDHVMVVDADDCVSNRLAAFVNAHMDSDGWVIKQGYIYKENDLVMRHEKIRFNQQCGSCNILKFEQCPLPEDGESFSNDIIYFYSGFNHGRIEAFFKNKGLSIDSLRRRCLHHWKR
jgi:glycosyltransferase involved in cell wall biosynthesis